MRTWWNAATRCRRRAIKEYWRGKADHLKTNQAFSIFIQSRKSVKKTLLKVDIEGVIERDQRKIAEHFANISLQWLLTMVILVY